MTICNGYRMNSLYFNGEAYFVLIRKLQLAITIYELKKSSKILLKKGYQESIMGWETED